MKCQPPSVRTDTVLFTLMGILLLAEIAVGFEDIFFPGGKICNQMQANSVHAAHLQPVGLSGLVVCPLAMGASLI